MLVLASGIASHLIQIDLMALCALMAAEDVVLVQLALMGQMKGTVKGGGCICVQCAVLQYSVTAHNPVLILL